MRTLYLALSILTVSLVAACASPLAIGPDISKIERDAGTPLINKSVGYYIAADKREMSVVTPGGGGSKVTYQPYKDMETAIYKMLSNVFKEVRVLKGLNDAESVKQYSIDYVVTPVIITDSSSSGLLTWMPTRFTVNLTCNVTDGNGNPVASRTVIGEGTAEFGEIKSDFSLAGKRATQDAVLKMQGTLLHLPELRR